MKKFEKHWSKSFIPSNNSTKKKLLRKTSLRAKSLKASTQSSSALAIALIYVKKTKKLYYVFVQRSARVLCNVSYQPIDLKKHFVLWFPTPHHPEPSGRAVHRDADGLDIGGQHGRRLVLLRHTQRPKRRTYPICTNMSRKSDTGAEAVKPDTHYSW